MECQNQYGVQEEPQRKQAQRRQEKGIEERKISENFTKKYISENNIDGDLGDPVPRPPTAKRPQAVNICFAFCLFPF